MVLLPLSHTAQFSRELIDKFSFVDTYQIIVTSLVVSFLVFSSVTPIPANPHLFAWYSFIVVGAVAMIYASLSHQGFIDMPGLRLLYALVIPLLFVLPLHIIYYTTPFPLSPVSFFSNQVGYAWFWGFLAGIGADVIYSLKEAS